MDYIELSEMTKEEFEEIVNKPIKLAYRINNFLSEDQMEFWYQELKYHEPDKLKSAVHRWISFNSKLPVLADIKPRSV